MGLIVMVAGGALVYFVLRSVLPAVVAFLLALVVLVVWFLINVHAATTGLVRANLRVYFGSRAQGEGHEEALTKMLASRYPFDEARALRVIASATSSPIGEDPRSQVRSFVMAIFNEENGHPSPQLHLIMCETIEREIERAARRCGIKI